MKSVFKNPTNARLPYFLSVLQEKVNLVKGNSSVCSQGSKLH